MKFIKVHDDLSDKTETKHKRNTLIDNKHLNYSANVDDKLFDY